MFRRSITLAAAVMLAMTGCSPGIGTPAADGTVPAAAGTTAGSPQPTRSPLGGSAYNTPDEIQATLANAGHGCTHAEIGELIRGATDSSQCSSPGTSRLDTQIIVFTDSTAATRYAATAVLSPYGLVIDTTALLGPNWVLTTTSATYAQTAQHVLGGSILPPRHAPSPTATPSPVAQQVQYRCTGNAHDGVTITYGPEGSYNSASHLPFEHTDPLDPTTPNYYSVSAQLQGSGSVSCSTTVTYDDGTGTAARAAKNANANGGRNTATAEVCADPIGGWLPC